MQRQREELVPIGEAVSELDVPGPAIRDASPSALRPFTVADQVHQLRWGPRSGPRPGLSGANNGALLTAPHQSWQPERVQARQRPLHALHEHYGG